MWCKRYPDAVKRQLAGQGSVVTIGAYDGVHRGHLELLARTRAKARELGLPAVVMSFEPTPKEFFAKNAAPPRITRFAERANLFRQAGMDGFFCPRFNAALASIAVNDFIDDYLSTALAARHIVVGDDFRFGRRAEGSVDDLLACAATGAFTVEQLGSVVCEGQRISSTAIRQALSKGNMALAAELLGRPYRLTGRVVSGEQLGRTLGFPTANIRLKRLSSPVSGIFAVRALIGDQWMDAVASIGTRPTVNGSGILLEVFVLDFEGDLYGNKLEVELVAKLRDELKFESLDKMVEQMHRDVAAARTALARQHGQDMIPQVDFRYE